MSARSLNGLNSNTTNVYVNTNLSATLPVEVNQSSFNNPITVGLKGLSNFTGAGKIIKINSNNDGLEYDDETDTLYSAITPLVINPLNNEISLSGLVGYGTAGYVLKTNGVSNTVGWVQEQDTVYSFTSPLLNNGSNTISLGGLTAFGYADRTKAIVVNGAGTALEYATQVDTTYTFSSPLVNFFGANNITLDTVPTGKGGTGLLSYTSGDLLYYSSGNVLTKLGIGLLNQVLTVDSGVPVWRDTAVPDLTTSKNFGTAVPGGNTIKLGNSAGTNQTTPLELYTSGTLKIYNTSNVNVATFTPVSNNCNLDLKGGLITTATLSTNTLWNGTSIGIEYGGTGLSTLSGQSNKLLQVNSGGTGYTFTTLPTSLFALTSSTIHPTSSAYNLALGQATSASSTYTLYVNGKIFTNDTITTTASTAFSTGFNNFSLPSTSGTLALTTQIPTAIWSLSGGIISPASSSNYTLQIPGASSRVVGNIANPGNSDISFVRFGGFQDLYTVDTYVSNLYVENHTGSNYQNVKLTCNSAFDTLQINKNTDITGILTATTSVTSNKFLALNTTSNYFESNSSYGWGLYGNLSGRQLSIRGKNSNFPYLGSTPSENFVIHMENFGNAYEITTPSTGSQSDINHHFYGNIQSNGSIVLTNPATGSQSDMGKLKFNSENDNCYMSEQFKSNAPTGDFVWKIGGGDIRMYSDNTPNSDASNYQALIYLNGSSNGNIFQIYAGGSGGSSTNIFLSGSTFDGNRSYIGGSSDDRLKFEEELITNATDTLMKLRPQIYMKDDKLPQRRNRKDPNIIEDNEDIIRQKEAGLIAQEVYYECPELRYLVVTRVENEEDIQELPDGVDLNDIQNDPDYENLGWDKYTPANVKYIELVPYLIKSNQEQQLEIDTLKSELTDVKEMLNKLVNAKSFSDFKKNIT